MQENDESEETPSRKELLQNIADLQERLERRNNLLNVVTKAYHRDTVCNDLNQRSLDLRPYLSVFAPHDSKLLFRPCHACGGTAELVCREDRRVKELSKKLEHTTEQWRSQIKDISYTVSTEREHFKNEKSRFAEEKKRIQKDMEDSKTCSQYLFEDFRSRCHHLENIRVMAQRNFRVLENSNILYIVDNACLGMFANELEQVLSSQSTAYDQIQEKYRNALNRNENLMRREKETEAKFDIAKKNLLHAQDEKNVFQRNVLKTKTTLEQVRQKLDVSEEDKQRLKRKYDRTILQMEQSQSGLNNDIEEIRKELGASRDQLELAREEIKNLSLINSKHDEFILKNDEEVIELAKLKIEKERVDLFCESVCAFIWELVSRFENITSVIHKKFSPMSNISTLKFTRRTKESSDLLSKDFQGRKLSIVKNIDLCCSGITKTIDAGIKELSSDRNKEIETLKKENDTKTKDLIEKMRNEQEKFEIILDKERAQSSKYEGVCERLRKENQRSESELQILKTKARSNDRIWILLIVVKVLYSYQLIFIIVLSVSKRNRKS